MMGQNSVDVGPIALAEHHQEMRKGPHTHRRHGEERSLG